MSQHFMLDFDMMAIPWGEALAHPDETTRNFRTLDKIPMAPVLHLLKSGPPGWTICQRRNRNSGHH